MTIGTILYCFILVAVIFLIQLLFIIYCISQLHKQIDKWKELQETRKIYLNNWLSGLECTLDGINYKIDNLSDKVDNLNK